MTSKIKVNILADGGDNSIITSDGAGSFTASSSLASSVQSVGGIQMTPAFYATLSSDQTSSDDAWVKAQVNTEVLDTDGCYDNATNYRFTPTTSGKYYIFGQVCNEAETVGTLRSCYAAIYRNGSLYAFSDNNLNSTFGEYSRSLFVGTVVDFNGSTDYVELYANMDVTSGTPKIGGGGSVRTFFGGYRIIGA